MCAQMNFNYYISLFAIVSVSLTAFHRKLLNKIQWLACLRAKSNQTLQNPAPMKHGKGINIPIPRGTLCNLQDSKLKMQDAEHRPPACRMQNQKAEEDWDLRKVEKIWVQTSFQSMKLIDLELVTLLQITRDFPGLLHGGDSVLS